MSYDLVVENADIIENPKKILTPKFDQIRFLSMGAGVQTVAMMYMYPERYDFVVFADVSNGTNFDEHAKTYWFIENYIKPFCEKNNMQFVSVTPKADRKSLYEYSWDHAIIPTREMRWCTERFKMEPIFNWAKQMGATRKEPFMEEMGFSFDEYFRSTHLKHPKYIEHNFPLVEDKITRDQCKKFILDKIGILPPKSGCVYCPHAKKAELRALNVDVDDKLKIDKIIALEKHNRRYPEMTLKNKVEQIRGKKIPVPIKIENLIGANEMSMDSFLSDEDDSCLSGRCFN